MSGPSLPIQGWITLRRSGAMAMDNPSQLGDVIAVVPPGTYALPPPVPKASAEDLQIASFSQALGLAESQPVSWERSSDQDAPDRTITTSGQRMEIELTALTAGKLRAERQRLSDVAKLVREIIAVERELSAALVSWSVHLFDAADLPMPNKSGARATAERITTRLAMLATTGAALPSKCDGAAAAGAQYVPGDSRGAIGPIAERQDYFRATSDEVTSPREPCRRSRHRRSLLSLRRYLA
jgi:hypothetical protein